MSFWKRVGESIKKTSQNISEEIKTRQEITRTKRQILNIFEIGELKRICKDYGIGTPSKYEENLITGERHKRTITREHYINIIMSRLALEQIKNFSDKHRIKIWDIVKGDKGITESIKIEKQKGMGSRKKGTTTEIKGKSEFDDILEDIKKHFELEHVRDEDDFEKQLIQFLKTKYPNRVKRQVDTRKGKIDIVIDNRCAIELKIADGKGKLRNLLGQVHSYKKVYEEVAVILLDVGKLSKSVIREYIDDYKDFEVRTIVLEGVLKRRKGRSRQVNIKF